MSILKYIDEAFSQSDLQYDKVWLQNNHYIVALEKQYNDDMYKDCNILLDLFCLQQMKEVAFAISEDYDYDIKDSLYSYVYIINTIAIDFDLFVLLAGEDYFNSTYYNKEFEDREDNQLNVLHYLLNKNYNKIVKILQDHYQDDEKLLLSIIEPFHIYNTYQDVLKETETIDDYMDIDPEVIKLNSWARDGFNVEARL